MKYKINAWDWPTNSIPYKMRGRKNCSSCEGNGYYWTDLCGGSWIRCPACFELMSTDGEEKGIAHWLV